MRLFDVEALDCLSWTDGDQIWEELNKVFNMPNVLDEAKEIIGNLMLALDDD